MKTLTSSEIFLAIMLAVSAVLIINDLVNRIKVRNLYRKGR